MTPEERTEMDAAAARLQAAQRGRMARKEVAQMKQEKAEALAVVASLNLPDAAVPEGGPENEHAEAIPAPELTAEELAELDQAALKIQAIQRGRMARREVEALKTKEWAVGTLDEADAEKLAAAEEVAAAEGVEEANDDEEDAELEKAALKIQAVQRGRMARREVAGKKGGAPEGAEPSSSSSRPVSASAKKEFVIPERPSTPEDQLPGKAVQLEHVLGLDAHGRDNMHLLGENTVLTSAGNSVLFIEIDSGNQQRMLGRDGGGIGALAVHPSGQFFAVGEMCPTGPPNIYIYTFPERKMVQVLPAGTERAYSCMSFSPDGKTLAAVGSSPDYMLTLWNWEAAGIVLRSKAFSQEVYKVSFSKRLEGTLYTSGTGHIRFWRMARTFTGLKLQGDLGRFGAVPLSDINGYLELPNFKVLTGTETGDLLLWDGGLIEAILSRRGGKPCHAGCVDVLVELNVPGWSPSFLSGGHDGYLRVWDRTALLEMEVGEGSNRLEVEPTKEIFLGTGRKITALTVLPVGAGTRWLVQDASGALLYVHYPESGQVSISEIMTFPAGGVTAILPLPRRHRAITASANGAICVFDYRLKKREYASTLPEGTGVSSMIAYPSSKDPTGRLVLVGSHDGSVRCLVRCENDFKRVHASRPHGAAVTALAANPSGTFLATAAADGTFFIYALGGECGGILTPLGGMSLIPRGGRPAAVTSLDWRADGQKVLAGLASGEIFEIDPITSRPANGSYVTDMPTSLYTFVLPRQEKTPEPEEDDDDDEGGGAKAKEGGDEDDPEAAEKALMRKMKAEEKKKKKEAARLAALREIVDRGFPVQMVRYAPDLGEGEKGFVVQLGGAAGAHRERLWRCALGSELVLPGALLPGSSIGATTTTISFGVEGTLTVAGMADGRVLVARREPSPALTSFEASPPKALGGPTVWAAPVHSLVGGAVTAAGVALDGSYLVTGAADGTLMVLSVDVAHFPGLATGGEQQPESLPTAHEEKGWVAAPELGTDVVETLEEERTRKEAEALQAASELKKRSLREQMAALRAKHAALVRANAEASANERVAEEDLQVDPTLNHILANRRAEYLKQVELEGQWDVEKSQRSLSQVVDHFHGPLEMQALALKALWSGQSVQSIRCRRLPEGMDEEMARLSESSRRTEHAGMSRRRGGGAGLTGGNGEGDDGDAGETGDRVARTKHDEWRLAREARQREYATFLTTKPDPESENPADLAMIQEARDTMGDHRLKMSKDYLAPKVADARGRRMLILELEGKMHARRTAFNESWKDLRGQKVKLLARLQTRLRTLRTLAEMVGQDALNQPSLVRLLELQDIQGLTNEEVDDWLWMVSPTDREAYLAKKAAAAAALAKGGGGGGFGGGFGGGGGGGGGDTTEAAGHDDTAGGDAEANREVATARSVKPGVSRGASDAATGPHVAAAVASPPLPVAEQLLLEYQIETMAAKLTAEVDAFDAAVHALRKRRHEDVTDIEYMSSKQLVAWKEMQMLEDFEKGERKLQQKLEDKETEAEECEAKMDELKRKVRQKQDEAHGVAAAKAGVVKAMNELVPDSHAFREPLMKVFLKKIKRKKVVIRDKDGSDGSDSEDEDEDDDDDEDYDSDMDSDEEEEACPAGCDPLVFEKVCDLRERRLDEEENAVEVAKALDMYKKEVESSTKKLAAIEKILANILNDQVAFQKSKQQALNVLTTSLSVSASQVKFLHPTEDAFPLDLAHAIVFSQPAMHQLQGRIAELVGDQDDLRLRQKQLRVDHKKLVRSRREKELGIEEAKAKAREIQMLKFGRTINLEVIDKALERTDNEELMLEYKKQEREQARAMAELDARILAGQEEVAELTLRNTQLLEDTTQLLEEQRHVAQTMKTAKQALFHDPVLKQQEETRQRDGMIQVVQEQAHTIDMLRETLARLRSKNGSIHVQ